MYVYIYIYIYIKSASRFSRGTVLNTPKQSRTNIMRGKKGRNHIPRQACLVNRFTLLSSYIKEIYIFFAHQKETLCDEKRKYIHRLFNIFFQIATFSKMDLYIYLDINFRSIVLFSDGKIADRQTNNSFNSLMQSRSFILEILIPPNSDCSRSNH